MAERKTARKRARKSVLNDAEAMVVVLQRLKEKAGPTVDYAAAMIEPEWQVATDEMEENPHMELILYADLGDFRIYAVTVTDEHMLTVPSHVPKISWCLMWPDDDENIGGGAADIEQAKHFATLAYQAACGVITSGSA
jgi:hypothetical protein